MKNKGLLFVDAKDAKCEAHIFLAPRIYWKIFHELENEINRLPLHEEPSRNNLLFNSDYELFDENGEKLNQPTSLDNVAHIQKIYCNSTYYFDLIKSDNFINIVSISTKSSNNIDRFPIISFAVTPFRPTAELIDSIISIMDNELYSQTFQDLDLIREKRRLEFLHSSFKSVNNTMTLKMLDCSGMALLTNENICILGILKKERLDEI